MKLARIVVLGFALCCLSACEYARRAVEFGQGPFDESARLPGREVFLGMHEVSWDSGNFEAGTLLVTNKRGNDLSVVDLALGREVRRVPTCTNPHELAVSPDGAHLAIACYGGRTVDILSATTFERAASVDLGENARPHGIIWHQDGQIFVTAEGLEQVVEVTTPLARNPQLIRRATGKQGSHMLAVAPDRSWAWTTDLSSKTVTRIDLGGETPPLSVTVGEEPEGIELSADGTALWVSARGSNQVFELDPVTMEVRKTLNTGRFPLRIAVRPQGDVAITSNLADGSLSVIDLRRARVVRTIRVSSQSEAQERFQVTILWSADGTHIYVAQTGSNTIAEVDYASGTVLRHIKVGDGGDGLAFLPSGSDQ